MSESTVPRLSSLVDDLLSVDAPPFHQLYADDQAVLVFDSTEVVQPAPVGSTDRRAFLARASILSLAIPGVGAALTASSPAGGAETAVRVEAIVGMMHHSAVSVGVGRELFGRYDRPSPPMTEFYLLPDFLTFRGRSNRHLDAPIRVKVGDNVRFWVVSASGGVMFELMCDVAGEFPFVNHGFGHGQRGAIGYLVVEP